MIDGGEVQIDRGVELAVRPTVAQIGAIVRDNGAITVCLCVVCGVGRCATDYDDWQIEQIVMMSIVASLLIVSSLYDFSIVVIDNDCVACGDWSLYCAI